MKIKDLIGKFSEIYLLPIEIDVVVEQLRNDGIKDEIYYWWDKKVDPKIIKGTISRWTYPNGNGSDVPVVDITYGCMGNDLERIVCCKELLHILDSAESKVRAPAEIERLISKITLPSEVVDPFADNQHSVTDRIAILQALAVLFPLSARNFLKPHFDSGKLNVFQISALAELPPGYIAYAMSDDWTETHAQMLALPI